MMNVNFNKFLFRGVVSARLHMQVQLQVRVWVRVLMLVFVLMQVQYGNCDNSTFTLTEEPSLIVKQDSIQTITWETSVELKEVRLDLYQNSRFMAKLGETNKNTKTFAWKVGTNAARGSNYFIKVSVVDVNDRSAWANTNTFQIVSQYYVDPTWIKVYWWSILLGVGLICLCCCWVNSCTRKYKKKNNPALMLPLDDPVAVAVANPVATAVANPVATAIVNPSAPVMYVNDGYGYGNRYGDRYGSDYVAYNDGQSQGRTEGFMAGVFTDELLRSSSRGDGGFGGNDGGFGGGDFGSSLFGGSGGDDSGGFS